MANEQNLIPFVKGHMSREEAQRRGRAGAKKRTENLQRRKTMHEMLDYLLSKDIQNKKGETMQTQEAILVSAIGKAIKGDIRAMSFIRDTIGEKPVDFVQQTGGKEIVYITPEMEQETQKHIDDIINAK